MALLIGALAAFLGGALLSAAATRVGWTDRVEANPDRKEAGARVPLVGGAAVLLGAVAAGLAGASIGGLPWPALLAAFALGLADDLRAGGLAPGHKLAGQAAVALLFALMPGAGWAGVGLLGAVGLAALAVVSMNAINLFDHADGTAGGQSAIALAGPSWPIAAGAVGYLPLNLWLRTGPTSREGRAMPRAMLGDSGAHALGLAVAASPGAAVLLLVPLLDAARVAHERWQRGVPPWRGDRTHIGHRLAAVGLGPTGAAAATWALSAPLVVARAVGSGATPLLIGAALTAAAYGLAVRATAPFADALEPRDQARPETGPGA